MFLEVIPPLNKKMHSPWTLIAHQTFQKYFFLTSTKIYIPGVWFEGGVVVGMTAMKQIIIHCVHCN